MSKSNNNLTYLFSILDGVVFLFYYGNPSKEGKLTLNNSVRMIMLYSNVIKYREFSYAPAIF